MSIDISKHPLIKQAYEVCQAIEKCGASTELTDAVTKASALMQEIANLTGRMDELESAESRIAELEKGHCGAPLLEREEAHVKTVSGLLAELGRWQQESSTWQSVAEKQLAIATEAEAKLEAAERRNAELDAREIKPAKGEVLVTVSGFTGCGKSAIAGEIEIAMRAIGVPVKWENGDAEKRMTGADWLTAIEMYNPSVRLVEINVPRAAATDKGE